MKTSLKVTTAALAISAFSVIGCEHTPTAGTDQQSTVADASACQVSAPYETAQFDNEFETKIDGLMAHMMDRGIAPGAVVQITQKGETVLKKAYGFADLEDQKPMQTDSLFRIYSMTKAVTTIAALQLVDKAQLELDAPISRYLPAFADIKVATDETGAATRPPSRAPTIRDLMRHTTGLTYRTGAKTDPIAAIYAKLGVPAGPGVSDAPTNGMDPVVGNEMFAERISMAPLKHDPGQQFTYGNSTDVLGAVVATVSGQSLSDYLDENIFIPTGMTDSSFIIDPERQDDFTSAYIVPSQTPARSSIDYTTPIDDLKPQTPYRVDPYRDGIYTKTPDFEFGGAGMVADADDYLAFTNALINGSPRLVSPEIWAEASRDQLPATAKAQDAFLDKRGFGLGFAVRESETHDGTVFPQCGLFWAGAASTYFWIDEETETTGVLMTQVFEGDVRSYFQELLNTIYAKPQ